MIMASNHSINRYTLGVVLGMSVLLSGCSSNTVTPDFYTLNVTGVKEMPVSLEETQQSSVSVGLWPVHVADVLDRTGIVSYGSGNQVAISGKHLWAGALDKNVERVLTAELIQALGDQSILTYPWDRQAEPEYQLRVRVESLAGPLAGPVELIADWTIKSSDGTDALQNRRARYVETVTRVDDDIYKAYVEAINRVVQRFSVDMAVLIQRLE